MFRCGLDDGPLNEKPNKHNGFRYIIEEIDVFFLLLFFSYLFFHYFFFTLGTSKTSKDDHEPICFLCFWFRGWVSKRPLLLEVAL